MKKLKIDVKKMTFWHRLTLCGLAAAGVGASQPTAPSPQVWDHDPSFLFMRPEFSWGRDPFGKKPGFSNVSELEPDYTVTAILHDGPDSEAIINDQRVMEGDQIGWRYVEKIGPNYVLLSDGDSTIETTLSATRAPAGLIQLEEVKGER